MMPMFGPVAIKALEPRIRQWAEPRSSMRWSTRDDAISRPDVAKVFPVTVFMEIMGMDLARLASSAISPSGSSKRQNDAAEMGRLSGIILGDDEGTRSTQSVPIQTTS